MGLGEKITKKKKRERVGEKGKEKGEKGKREKGKREKGKREKGKREKGRGKGK